MFHELLTLENEHISSYFKRGSRIVVFATTFVVEIKRCIMDPAQDDGHFSSRVNNNKHTGFKQAQFLLFKSE